MAVANSLNTKTHSSKEMTEFSFKNADLKSICQCKQRMKSKLSLSSECVETKLCKPCTSFTWHIQSSCGMVWYRTLTLNVLRHMHTTPHWLRWKTCTVYRALLNQILKWVRVCYLSCLLQEIPSTNPFLKQSWAIFSSICTGIGFGV